MKNILSPNPLTGLSSKMWDEQQKQQTQQKYAGQKAANSIVI